MRELKINHQLLGELKVTIGIQQRIWLNIENNDIGCSLYKTDKGTALQFYGEKLIKKVRKKIGGLKISQEEYDMIKLAIEEDKKEEYQKQYDEFLAKEKVSYHTSYNFFLPELSKDKYTEKAQDKVRKILEERKLLDNADMGEYSITWTYTITGAELIKLLDEAQIEVNEIRKQKEAEKQEKINAIFAKAKETGEPQELERYVCDCNDPKEECNTDIVSIYAMPDGSKKTVRSHTW